MANILHGTSSTVGRSFNMKIPDNHNNRWPGFSGINPGIREYIDKIILNVKKHSYKLLFLVMFMTLSIVIVPSLFGCQFEAIRSGSMSPAIDTGSLAITRPVNPYSIEVGDVIAYRSPTAPDTLVIHRVAGIENDSTLSFRTKGDANKTLDAYVLPAEAVEGQVKLSIPLAGYLAGFARSSAGYVILLAIPGAIVLYMELNKLWMLLGLKLTVGQRLRNFTLPLSGRRNPPAYDWRLSYRPYHRNL
jgi:signal peptidase